MRALLIESSPGVGAEAAASLAAAGHEVVRCEPEGASAFPCTEVSRPGSCPLDGPDRVDAVLVTRAVRDREPTIAEAGVTCAVRLGVPVTVLGHSSARNPFAGWTQPALSSNPLLALEAAVAAAHEAKVEPLRAEVLRMLEASGADPSVADVDVCVTEHDGRAHIAVVVPRDLPVSVDAIATHVHSRYRDGHLGQTPQVIDVSVGHRD